MSGLFGLLIEVEALDAVVKATKKLKKSSKVDSII